MLGENERKLWQEEGTNEGSPCCTQQGSRPIWGVSRDTFVVQQQQRAVLHCAALYVPIISHPHTCALSLCLSLSKKRKKRRRPCGMYRSSTIPKQRSFSLSKRKTETEETVLHVPIINYPKLHSLSLKKKETQRGRTYFVRVSDDPVSPHDEELCKVPRNIPRVPRSSLQPREERVGLQSVHAHLMGAHAHMKYVYISRFYIFFNVSCAWSRLLLS